ncbi:MAG: nucleoside hydrolase [Lachnospiraceae bacterium]|jgi:ribosylpyrimidine nucleosidase|nr:nucleoside hydrolase [Lachnospiraceae bacterium]
MVKKQKIIIDCDPGHDDAINIMLAGSSDKLDVLGITVVAGNQTIEKTVKNALRVCQYLDLSYPVYAGCPQPMIRARQMIADDIHGETGLDGPVFPELTRNAEDIHAVLFLIDTIMKSEGDIIITPTGPLTNIAMAMRLEPKIVPKIKRIVLMGGSYQMGNVTPAAEFNIIADADAAHVVFSSGVPLTMCGLDVTRKVLCFPEIVDRMRKIGNKAASLFADLMTYFNKSQKEVFGWDGGPLHDPVTVASILEPELLKIKPMYTEIDIRGLGSYGRTNCDYFGYSKRTPNVDVAIDIDVEKFWDTIGAGIKAYSA